MNLVIVQHTVADFRQWQIGYDDHEHARKAAGATSSTVGRGATADDGSTEVTIVMQFPDLGSAKGFLDDPGLAAAMQAAGIVGIPDVRVVELVASATY